MPQSFQQILELLDRHGVEYVVVGGVAAVLQGAPVTTFDIDALFKVSDDNAKRLLGALSDLDAWFREHGPGRRPTLDDIRAGGHLLLMTRAGPLDVLGFIGRGQRYEDLSDAVERMRIGKLDVPVLNLDELIAQKKATGRDKDQPALRLLQALREKRERTSD